MAGLEESAKSFDVKGVIYTLIVSAFGFVAALSWNSAIQELISEFVPAGSGVLYSFIAAMVVTVIAILVIWLIAKYMAVSARLEGRLKQRIKPAGRKYASVEARL